MKVQTNTRASQVGKLLLYAGLLILAAGLLLLILVGTPITVWLSLGGLLCAVTGAVLRTTNFE